MTLVTKSFCNFITFPIGLYASGASSRTFSSFLQATPSTLFRKFEWLIFLKASFLLIALPAPCDAELKLNLLPRDRNFKAPFLRLRLYRKVFRRFQGIPEVKQCQARSRFRLVPETQLPGSSAGRARGPRGNSTSGRKELAAQAPPRRIRQAPTRAPPNAPRAGRSQRLEGRRDLLQRPGPRKTLPEAEPEGAKAQEPVQAPPHAPGSAESPPTP